jgi:16S rRNA (guanine527-N7)-methyltransferase
MGADSLQLVVEAASYLQVSLDNRQKEQLQRFHRWLAEEAIPAGGVGPHEHDRLWNRHIADSLLFGVGLSYASDCLDIGSGIGLPGIPLAIAYPEIEFTLLDRSGRRCDLARRAIAVLRLANCTVAHTEIGQMAGRFDAIVSRAAISPDRLLIHVKRLLAPSGVAILGLSRMTGGKMEVPCDDEVSISVLTIPTKILDTAAHLLRIEAT